MVTMKGDSPEFQRCKLRAAVLPCFGRAEWWTAHFKSADKRSATSIDFTMTIPCCCAVIMPFRAVASRAVASSEVMCIFALLIGIAWCAISGRSVEALIISVLCLSSNACLQKIGCKEGGSVADKKSRWMFRREIISDSAV